MELTATEILLHLEKIADTETYNHSTRVHKLTKKLIKHAKTKYSEEEIKEILTGALLHDVGKQYVFNRHNDSIYSEDDKEIMGTHTVIGKMIVEPMNSDIITNIVSMHHAEKDVPEYVLLVKIADIYDALTSKRAYKDCYPPEKAISILIKSVPEAIDYVSFLVLEEES